MVGRNACAAHSALHIYLPLIAPQGVFETAVICMQLFRQLATTKYLRLPTRYERKDVAHFVAGELAIPETQI